MAVFRQQSWSITSVEFRVRMRVLFSSGINLFANYPGVLKSDSNFGDAYRGFGFSMRGSHLF